MYFFEFLYRPRGYAQRASRRDDFRVAAQLCRKGSKKFMKSLVTDSTLVSFFINVQIITWRMELFLLLTRLEFSNANNNNNVFIILYCSFVCLI